MLAETQVFERQELFKKACIEKKKDSLIGKEINNFYVKYSRKTIQTGREKSYRPPLEFYLKYFRFF